jgi:pimeloyl-ACP methyl ester carboxylesterase
MSLFHEMTRQEVELEGRKYPYWVKGDSKNPPLVLLYGFTGVAKDFIELSELLKDKYFIIIPEYPGWNGSPRFEDVLTIHNYAKFVKKLLTKIGYQQVNVFGHCLGAVVAIEFTYLYPETVSRLILVSTPYLSGSKAEKFQKFVMSLAERSPKSLRPVFFFWRSRVFAVPLDFFAIKVKNRRKKLARIKEHIFKQSFEPEDAVEENWISFVDFDFRKVKQINVPVYLIHGGEDIMIGPAQSMKLKRLFPKASLNIISQAGHVPPVETPKELAQLTHKYLDS